MRYLIIGDIHGCIEELKELVELFKPGRNDQILCVGDVLNRYHDSSETLAYLQSINARSVIGNHEMWFLHNIENFQTLSRGKQERVNNLNAGKYYKWIRTWPFYLKTEYFTIIHAGLEPTKSYINTSLHNLVSLREINGVPWYKYYQGKELVFYGHWAKQGFHTENNTVCLDGGCVYGKNMIGCIATEGKFAYIKVAAKKVYEKIVIK